MAETKEAIYIDLVDEERRIVEVTRSGWRIVVDAPVKFVRPKGVMPLPAPVTGGSIDSLRPFLNVEDDHHFVLIVAWMVAAMKPRGPFPILDFIAEHGGGKTSASRFVRALVDPNVSSVRSAPRELRDLAVAATSAHVLAYDNLSGVQPWLSDGLCRVATGGGFATRALYTDAEEQIFDFVRPIILNGIDDIANRADLADRCLLIRLPSIPKEKRKREKVLWRDFELAAPSIFGALLTGLVGALSGEESVALTDLPRMADFAIFSTAAEQSLGWPAGTFKAAYDRNLADAVQLAVEADSVAIAVQKFMFDLLKWTGTATDLLRELRSLVGEEGQKEREWPKAANALSNRLRRAAPGLRKLGIEIDLGDRGAAARLLTITRTS